MQIIRVDTAGLPIAISLVNPTTNCDIRYGCDGSIDDGLILSHPFHWQCEYR